MIDRSVRSIDERSKQRYPASGKVQIFQGIHGASRPNFQKNGCQKSSKIYRIFEQSQRLRCKYRLSVKIKRKFIFLRELEIFTSGMIFDDVKWIFSARI